MYALNSIFKAFLLSGMFIVFSNSTVYSQCATFGGLYDDNDGVSQAEKSDGEPDDDMTGDVKDNDWIRLTYPPITTADEICITVGFDKDDGVVDLDLNGTITSVTNPSGEESYTPQQICIPVALEGPLLTIIST